MTITKIRELLEQQPFIPLVLYTSNGRSHVIDHPELAIVTKHALYVFSKVEQPEEGEVATSPSVISYIHITEIVPAPEKAA